jgi:acyl-CoA synthetase (AMP-forming)/AMP-acid ligase II
MNTSLLLEMVTEGAPDRVVVGPRDGGLTAAELMAKSRRLAHYLLATGAERVGLVDVNSEAVPLILFGAALAGVPYAPVNYRLSDEQLTALLQRLAPGVVIVEDEVIARVGPIDGLTMMTRRQLLELVEVDQAGAGDLPFVDPDEVGVMLFTSGTTGEPKAALLRHRHLTSYILGSVEFLGAGPDEAQLVSVPPYHIAGATAVLSCLYSGRRLVYLSGFEPHDWVRTVQDERVTQAMVVPTMLGRILTCVEDNGSDLRALHHLSYGGGRMPVDVIERAMKVLPHVDFVNAYGLTETSSTIAVLTPEDHREAAGSSDPAVRRRLGSVGRPLPTIELEVRDPEGNPLGPDERGEIFVRGEQVSGEYQGRSVLTDDGWFPTNDAGWLDEDGYLFIDGRLDDVIIRGGENLSPGEIEATLLSHPSVAEAVVVGIPSEEWGETVGAAVALEPEQVATDEELKQWVRQRLRSARTPEVIQFRSEMPYNETGKLLRRVIRDELSQRA